MPDKKPKDKPKKPPKHPEAALYKALRQRAQDAIEYKLRSYFEQEAADCGFSSSFETLNHLASTGCGTRGTPDPHERMTNQRRLDAIKFHRTVHAALGAVGPDYARTLRAAYGDERLPGEVYGLYGPFAGVALLTQAARSGHAADPGRKRPQLGEWLRSGRSKDCRPAIRQEADAMLRDARACFQLAYERAREDLRGRRGAVAKDVQRIRELVRATAKRRDPLPVIDPITHTRAGLTQ